MSVERTKTKFCPAVLADGPRAGQVCGRRYMSGEGCEKHRPKRTYSGRQLTNEEKAAQRERRARVKASIGVPVGWEV